MLASIRAFLWRIVHLSHRSKSDAIFDLELEFHLQMEIEENLHKGMNAAEARRRALIALGGFEQTKEEYRASRGILWLSDLKQDLSYGARSLNRNPGFAVLVILMLGAALGVSAIMFSIINGILLLPLPYEDADRLIHIYSASQGTHGDLTVVDYIKLKKQCQSFEGMAAAESKSNVTLTDRQLPELIDVAAVNDDFFRIMGGKAVIGRILQPEDFGRERNDDSDNLYSGSVAVLGYRFWQGRYGGDKNLIGQTVKMNGRSILVVGIAAPEFRFPDLPDLAAVDCWVPRVFGESDTIRYVTAIGKIRGSATLEQAQAETDVISRGLSQTDRNWSSAARAIRLLSLQESVVGKVRPKLLVLGGAVIFVLLIACSNLANLLHFRAAGRHKEMAVRSSIGASRRRLFRQLLTESVLLSVIGGTAGLLIAILSKGAVLAMAPSDLPRAEMITVDLRTFGFTFLIALVAGVLCGIVPALRASDLDLTTSLKQGASDNVLSGRRGHGSIFIAGQIAMALVLLIASGLMLRTYIRLQAVPLNFDAKNILIINATPPYFKPEYRKGGLEGLVGYSEALLTQIRKVAGVECAAMGGLPIPTKITRFLFYGAANIQLYPEGQPSKNLLFTAMATSPEYFRVIRAHLLSGRLPGSDGLPDAAPSAVVNETFAQKIWPDVSPVGKRLVLTRGGKTESIEVVGLVADTRTAGLEKGTIPVVYMPLAHNPGTFSGTMLVRCTTDPLSVVPSLRKALIAVDKDAALGKIDLLEQVLDSHYAARRFNLFIISILGALALFLAVIGVFATIAHSVSRRTHEIGIRMALGAQRRGVLALIIRQGLWMLFIGEAIGLTAAFALNKLLSSMVFGIATTDAATYLVVSFVWAVVAVFACLLPALRATRIDPLLALRCE